MVKKALLIIMIITAVVAPSTPNQAQTYCSAFCKPNSCNTLGFSTGDCTGCNTNLGWNKVSGLCTVNVAGY